MPSFEQRMAPEEIYIWDKGINPPFTDIKNDCSGVFYKS